MKRFITLLIASNALYFAAYSQTCDSTLKGINLSINAGLGCCRELEVYKGIVNEQDGAISDLKSQLEATEYKYSLKHGNFLMADSSYRDAALKVNECALEVERLKKGKRNWIIATLATIVAAGGGYFIFVK